jgi:hypothetical protein
MRTPRQRVEFRVNRIIEELATLGRIDAELTDKELEGIRVTLNTRVAKAVRDLGADDSFKLE